MEKCVCFAEIYYVCVGFLFRHTLHLREKDIGGKQSKHPFGLAFSDCGLLTLMFIFSKKMKKPYIQPKSPLYLPLWVMSGRCPRGQ